MQVSNGFQSKWNFPNCLGSLDGKHIRIRPPPKSGSVFFNYKKTFSIVLMALVDADYRFLYVDVGCNGRVSDGGVFQGCSLQRAFAAKSLGIPEPKAVPGGRVFPFTVLADEAFPLKAHIMKPYPQRKLTQEQRIFNYRLSRGRRVVENAFGHLANRFRIFLKAIPLAPYKVETLVKASCALHNFLSKSKPPSQTQPQQVLETVQEVDKSWKENGVGEMGPLPNTHARHARESDKEIRDAWCEYFNGSGAVPWQDSMV